MAHTRRMVQGEAAVARRPDVLFLRADPAPLRERLGRALDALVAKLSPQEQAQANAQPSDIAALVAAVSAAELVADKPDERARALLGVSQRKRALLDQAGETLSTPEVAKLLGITPQAVHKRRAGRRLLAVRIGGNDRYPRAQFGEFGPLPELPEMLQALTLSGDWAALEFFVSPDDDFLDGRSPLQVLRDAPALAGKVIEAAAAAGADGFS